jgi:hypothetical protein
MSLKYLSRHITLRKVYGLFPKLSGVVTAKAEQSLQGLDIALEQNPVGVSDQDAAIVASLRASAVRQRVGAFMYITVENELAFWCEDHHPLRMRLGTPTGLDRSLVYVANSVIEQLKALGISATWDATNKTVVIAS